MLKQFFLAIWLGVLALSQTACAATTQPWQQHEVGRYAFNKWAGGDITVEYIVPASANADTPVLIVVPGARRNADTYRDQWLALAKQHTFIVLAIGCSLQVCEDEYQYNLGGIVTPLGGPRPESVQFYSVPEKVFQDFTARFESNQKTFALYGHSAGGGFVHTYMLAKPDAPVSRAVAANPAFFTFPDTESAYPFGLANSPYQADDIDSWLTQPLTIILGDQDLGPRTKAISNSPAANAQGRNVYARGLSFYAFAMNTAVERDIQHRWQLEVVRGVGHSSGKIVPYAYKYLLGNASSTEKEQPTVSKAASVGAGQTAQTTPHRATHQTFGLLAGPLAFLLVWLMPAPESLNETAWLTAAVGIWMAIWWSTEAVHVAVTALLPLVLFPQLGILNIKAASAPYANPTIYLFLGGFMLALALQKANLHKRIAYFILSYVSSSARSIVLGFMVVSAILSMWMTNTSTTMMLLPIALSILSTLDDEKAHFTPVQQKHFQLSLLLGIAYAATIGGMSTLVGTPPNAFLVGFMNDNYDVQLDFAKWMLIGIPLSVTLLPLAWLSLTRWIYPVDFTTPEAARVELERQRKALGPIRKEEWRVGVLFLFVAIAWMTRPLLARWLALDGLSDAGIAMTAAVLLFVISNGKSEGKQGSLLEWDDMKAIPWGILVLFGGGLSLAAAVSGSGLAQWLGEGLVNMDAFGMVFLVLAATTLVIFLTELTSNLATAATFLPVVAVIALEMGGEPMTLILPVTLAASCAFMLPVATPPNAIVFSSGYISIAQMARAGFALNIVSVLLVTAIAVWLAPLVF